MINQKLATLILIGICVSQSIGVPTKSDRSCKYTTFSISEDDDDDPSFAESPLSVYHSFKAKDIKDNKMVDYCVTSIPQSRFEEAADFMVKHYAGSDPMSVIAEIVDGNHHKEDRGSWLKEIKKKFSVACFKCGTNDFLGICLFNVRWKTSEPDKLERGSGEDVVFNFNVFEHYNVDKYLYSDGVVVHLKYRRLGIAKQFFMIEKEICEKLGITVTSSVCTSDWSNAVADKLNYDTNAEFSMDEFYKKHPEIPTLPLTKLTRRSKKF